MLLLALTLAAAPCTKAICFDASGDARAVTLTAENRSDAAAALHVTVAPENASSSAGTAFDLELAPHVARAATRITTLGGPWKYRYDFRYLLGTPGAQHDDRATYALPFASGTAHRLVQGEHGDFTHHGEVEFAYDFDMPEGTPVLAAREGVVVDVKSDETTHGDGPEFADRCNYVYVLQPDGTLGEYLHLSTNGARVRVGDRVASGQLLGLSGNTGQSRGPHLHFEVNHRAAGVTRQTVPVVFRTRDGARVHLRAGETYAAP